MEESTREDVNLTISCSNTKCGVACVMGRRIITSWGSLGGIREGVNRLIVVTLAAV